MRDWKTYSFVCVPRIRRKKKYTEKNNSFIYFQSELSLCEYAIIVVFDVFCLSHIHIFLCFVLFHTVVCLASNCERKRKLKLYRKQKKKRFCGEVCCGSHSYRTTTTSSSTDWCVFWSHAAHHVCYIRMRRWRRRRCMQSISRKSNVHFYGCFGDDVVGAISFLSCFSPLFLPKPHFSMHKAHAISVFYFFNFFTRQSGQINESAIIGIDLGTEEREESAWWPACQAGFSIY